MRACSLWNSARATLTALARTDQLASHLGRALDNGVTQEELVNRSPAALAVDAKSDLSMLQHITRT
jgi:alkylhydroperoxidase/carboxymuconolactone decarboxylase family protein YurZ